ncbi:MAG: MoaD/ThiS family protein [Actinomycetota bacterium]
MELKPLPPLDKRVKAGIYEVADNVTIRQMLEMLGIPAREIREMRALLNGKHADMEARLEDGCTIVIIPTLAGG